jgi:putative pyruvate formate lyase activating enzyme
MAFNLFMPDAGAEEALPNYYSILKGKRLAKYIVAKHTPAKFDSKSSLEELTAIHDETLSAVNRMSTNPKDLDKMSKPKTSFLDLKLELARRHFENCNYCERNCGVDRNIKAGVCGVMESRISSEFLHFGEEPELVPSYTIFFAGCTFKCVFCQNWDISQAPEGGVKIPPKKVSKMIEQLTNRAKNTNWVGGDPTSNLKYILEVLQTCNGNIPQVWNSNMYLSESTIQMLNGVIDVYLTDFKYGPGDCAKRLSKVDNYWSVITRNHKIANEQTEMIVRHLVLPDHIKCCTRPILEWLAENLDTSRVRVNVMDQYHPDYNAFEHPELTRGLKTSEFLEAVSLAKELGLNLTD